MRPIRRTPARASKPASPSNGAHPAIGFFFCVSSLFHPVAQGNRRAYATSVAYFGLFTSKDSFSFAFDRSTGLAGSAARAGGVGSAAVGLLNSASFA
jgi:hypothetical protein